MPLWLSDPIYTALRRRRIVLTTTPIIWYAHYDTTTGELVSLGTVLPDPLPEGTATREYYYQPDQSVVIWDTTLREFVSRTPPTSVDRVADLESDGTLSSLWSGLDATETTALKDRIGQMLGPYRYRRDFQPTDLEHPLHQIVEP